MSEPNSQLQAKFDRSGETEAIIIIKAAPQVGEKHGETICCAGIDLSGNWLRLYPVSFRNLEDSQKFGRWDRVKFNWRRPNDDARIESRRVDQQSLQIVGKLKKSERQKFLSSSVVSSLKHQRDLGKSLALLKAKIMAFNIEPKSESDIAKEAAKFERIRNQYDMFKTEKVIPYKPCPFKFKYKYETDDGIREGTCQDWEIETTYFKWQKLYGQEQALEKINGVFGEEYPSKGMLMAMGTHSAYPDTWLINGIIRLDEIDQPSLL
ncbi:MAG: hypothetical protein GKS03_03340 [Alphaproteobacteria bacterium]|nr:hypothetical protein [Alphaproteobacteria bacterium]